MVGPKVRSCKKKNHKVNIPEGYSLLDYSHSKVLGLLPNQTSRETHSMKEFGYNL